MTSSSDNLLDGTPVPLIQIDTNTAPTADRLLQDNVFSANGTSDQPIHSSKSKVPHTDTSQASPYDMYDLTSTLSDCSHQEQYHDQSAVAISQPSSIETNEPFQLMLHCNDELVRTLSIDPEGIARTLLAKGLISEHTESQIQQYSTPQEKAKILVSTVRERISISPKQFHEFLQSLSKYAWTKDILKVLQSYINSKWVMTKDANIQAVVTDEQKSIDVENKPGRDSENHPFPILNPEDRTRLEEQLISCANSMRKKFASLLLSVIISFKSQGIDPQDLASGILALTEYEDPAIGKPLLERHKEKLKRAQTVNDTFDVLRPHMTFFNYEILEFLIEEMGLPNDQQNLQTFLQEFKNFCSRSVFEIPPNMLGHSEEKEVDQQKFAVKITKPFKVALLVQCKEYDQQATSSSPTSSDLEERERICSPKLGISLEDAKYIQRKLASVLNLNTSSVYLDSANSGCVLLTFLLPSHISLAGLDSNPDAIALSDIGIRILCGPPGKPELKELTSKGLVVQWSQPEYGCSTLKRYILYYQRKDNETMPLNNWQKIEISSQQTHACVPDLSDGDMYVFRVSSVSDAGTLQYSNERDPQTQQKLLHRPSGEYHIRLSTVCTVC